MVECVPVAECLICLVGFYVFNSHTMCLYHRITEYSEWEDTREDHQVQLTSLWPRQGLNPLPWHYKHHALIYILIYIYMLTHFPFTLTRFSLNINLTDAGLWSSLGIISSRPCKQGCCDDASLRPF